MADAIEVPFGVVGRIGSRSIYYMGVQIGGGGVLTPYLKALGPMCQLEPLVCYSIQVYHAVRYEIDIGIRKKIC